MIVLGWWWWVVVAPPLEWKDAPGNVRADVEVSHRSVGYARNEVEFQCRRGLDAECGDIGQDGPATVNWGGTQCHEDDDGWATCTVRCAGACTEREP